MNKRKEISKMGEFQSWSYIDEFVFCEGCGTICTSLILEEDVEKLNNGMTIKVISNEEAWRMEHNNTVKKFLKCGDSKYVYKLMCYHERSIGCIKHNFYHTDNGKVCDEFTLCDEFRDHIINRIAWYDENSERPILCPVCGNEIIKNWSYFDQKILKRKKSMEKHLRRHGATWCRFNPIQANKEYEDKFDPFECRQETDIYLKDCNNYTLSAPIKIPDKDSVNIAEYIDHWINMEMGIRYNSELLYNLLLNQRKQGRLARYERYGLLKKFELNLKRKALEQSQLAERFKLDDTKPDIEAFNLEKPQKKDIEKPFIAPPEYKKPSIFNKSKVLAENERIKQNYLIQVDKANKEYENAVKDSEEKYESELKEYNKKLAQMEEEYYSRQKEKNKKIEVQKAAEEHRLLEEQKHLEDEKKKFAENIDKQLVSSPNQQINDMLLQEIAEVKETLHKLFDAKHQLESLDIVYPKYLNFVALSTMSEYLVTGRCTDLTGADGAYNLYESEIRADRVIAQLDKVIDSLEQIKENQYKTYSLLKEVNDNISNISKKMNNAITALNNIQDQTKHIKDIKENSAMIAYNTAKTAYYTKVNNQLTNALGFLIALK